MSVLGFKISRLQESSAIIPMIIGDFRPEHV